MTSIINSSNSNSALINTINASDSKHNPNVYSTKKIYPAAATTYVTTTKSSGSVGANQTMVFDLMKYGIAQQMLLVYSKSGAASAVGALDFLDVIDRVELLSSSKVIDTLTKYDLLAQFSNLDSSQFNIVNKSLLALRGANPNNTHKFVVPLVFGFFKDINTNLNLQFNEPMSVRVRWGANIKNGSAGPAGGLEIAETGVYLKLRYKAYNESDFSEILTENYNEPELNQMSTGFYDENSSTKQLTAAGAGVEAMDITQPGVKVELKNTDCVNDFYIAVRQNDSYGASPIVGTGPYQPVQINRIRFTASGQEIFDMEGVELFYSKLCVNGFSILTNDESDLQNVVKIQTGLWEYAGGGTQSNTLSLRELNNPIIEVWFQDTFAGAATRNYDVVVVEDAVKIYSTTSATGRVMTSLSN